MGPVDKREMGQKSGFTPEDYSSIFKQIGITKVIRLNEAKYDRKRFIKEGISHADLYFNDGSNPSDEILNEFLNHCESHFNNT